VVAIDMYTSEMAHLVANALKRVSLSVLSKLYLPISNHKVEMKLSLKCKVVLYLVEMGLRGVAIPASLSPSRSSSWSAGEFENCLETMPR
jgi:hypothetical protein